MADELKGKNILIVDDDREIIGSIQLALADSGANITTASDGNTAVEMATANVPDLMILDMMLPKRSGFLILERIKKGKKKTDAPQVIMITGNPGMRHKVYAEGLGVSMYLNKPFRMDKLVQGIKDLLAPQAG